jgi:L-methionine (R)-S-oxide reductase
LFTIITQSVKEILKNKTQKTNKLKAICKLLKDRVSYYDWVGFYAVDKEQTNELVLNSFEGQPTEHIRIAFGKGVCGRAALLRKIFVVQDVSKETNYLSCSSKVKSEIVIPVFRNNEVVGELDIDSHLVSPFTLDDETFLSEIAEMVSALL